MTAKMETTGADAARRLSEIRDRLEATLKDPSAVASGALVGLEADVAAICADVPALPAAEAHALAPEMKHVIGLLELLYAAMKQQSETAATAPPADSAARHRQAAAAYGSNKRRKG